MRITQADRDRLERQKAPPGFLWSCSHCGPSPTSRSMWCDKGCGSDYNQMTLIPIATTPKEA